MFHRYVTHNGCQIDYDRASWLMDRELCQEAIRTLPSSLGRTPFDHAIAERNGWHGPAEMTKDQELQALWNMYCRLHQSKYGKPFSPEVM
jgi:hypothetical protein